MSVQFQVGDQVEVAPRTWPGINQPGGIGNINKIHCSNGYVDCVDVKYALGGYDSRIDLEFVKHHEFLTSRRVRGNGRAQSSRLPTQNTNVPSSSRPNRRRVEPNQPRQRSNKRQRRSSSVQRGDSSSSSPENVDSSEQENNSPPDSTAVQETGIQPPGSIEIEHDAQLQVSPLGNTSPLTQFHRPPQARKTPARSKNVTKSVKKKIVKSMGKAQSDSSLMPQATSRNVSRSVVEQVENAVILQDLKQVVGPQSKPKAAGSHTKKKLVEVTKSTSNDGDGAAGPPFVSETSKKLVSLPARNVSGKVVEQVEAVTLPALKHAKEPQSRNGVVGNHTVTKKKRVGPKNVGSANRKPTTTKKKQEPKAKSIKGVERETSITKPNPKQVVKLSSTSNAVGCEGNNSNKGVSKSKSGKAECTTKGSSKNGALKPISGKKQLSMDAKHKSNRDKGEIAIKPNSKKAKSSSNGNVKERRVPLQQVYDNELKSAKTFVNGLVGEKTKRKKLVVEPPKPKPKRTMEPSRRDLFVVLFSELLRRGEDEVKFDVILGDMNKMLPSDKDPFSTGEIDCGLKHLCDCNKIMLVDDKVYGI